MLKADLIIKTEKLEDKVLSLEKDLNAANYRDKEYSKYLIRKDKRLKAEALELSLSASAIARERVKHEEIVARILKIQSNIKEVIETPWYKRNRYTADTLLMKLLKL